MPLVDLCLFPYTFLHLRCPSVMAPVHPHVYLCYKAEESGRLKMKTPNRESLCARFVSVCMHAV